jgi:hypothetical protein
VHDALVGAIHHCVKLLSASALPQKPAQEFAKDLSNGLRLLSSSLRVLSAMIKLDQKDCMHISTKMRDCFSALAHALKNKILFKCDAAQILKLMDCMHLILPADSETSYQRLVTGLLFGAFDLLVEPVAALAVEFSKAECPVSASLSAKSSRDDEDFGALCHLSLCHLADCFRSLSGRDAKLWHEWR